MTYCVGVKVNEGLLFASDSRTNAGVDSVATFHKLFVFHQEGERLIVVMTAGNLAVTQEVITRLQQGLSTDEPGRNVLLAPTLFDVTMMVGGLLRTVIDRDRSYLQGFGADVSSSFIVGGQIAGDEPRLFLVYPAGNFIESEPATPYFQLGETKYGKPILERVLTPQTTLAQAAKCALLSFDGTIKANLSVAPPIDMLMYKANTLTTGRHREIAAADPYFAALCAGWSTGLLRVFSGLADPPWAAGDESTAECA
ncbi:MAG: peptidase [Defluviicoccus sp.]|nr:peptidase [Defluviicoccus sp.]MDG4610235.1 peptidase [Defluviicoccus sp.]